MIAHEQFVGFEALLGLTLNSVADLDPSVMAPDGVKVCQNHHGVPLAALVVGDEKKWTA